ncbi:methyltransferase domain-containing protein [Saccharomonospora sp. NPDC006951]
MPEPPAGHPDRLRWNERYRAHDGGFEPHPLLTAVADQGLPEGPVLELACGRSGSALALAGTGREVVAVDVSDVAIAELRERAREEGLADLVHCVLADASVFRPRGVFALVLATRYWDPAAFAMAAGAAKPRGLLGWEALAVPGEQEGALPPWHIRHGDLAARLPEGWTVLAEDLIQRGNRRFSRVLARKAGSP